MFKVVIKSASELAPHQMYLCYAESYPVFPPKQEYESPAIISCRTGPRIAWGINKVTILRIINHG